MTNKGVIVERVLDGDVPDGKNYVTKEGLEMQKYAVTENSYSSLQFEIKCFFFKISKFVKIIPAIGSKFVTDGWRKAAYEIFSFGII